MSPAFYNVISAILFIAHLIGFIWVLWGGWYLLKGVKGQGQSAEGVSALRNALLDLFKPIVWGASALLLLLAITFWEHSPLTILIQGIAPLSTMIWVIWSHFSARRVDPGEMFEALVPLSPPRMALSCSSRLFNINQGSQGTLLHFSFVQRLHHLFYSVF